MLIPSKLSHDELQKRIEDRKQYWKGVAIKTAIIGGIVYVYMTQLGLNLQAQEVEIYKQDRDMWKRVAAVPPTPIENHIVNVAAPVKDDATIVKIGRRVDGVLKPHAGTIYMAARNNNINPYLLYSIIRHETANGTSDAIKILNNPGGIMGRNGKLERFRSLESGINQMAGILKVHYVDQGLITVDQIGAKYCPVGAKNDPTGLNRWWVPKVNEYLKEVTENES